MSWSSEKYDEIEAAKGEDLLRIIARLLVQLSCDLESIENKVSR